MDKTEYLHKKAELSFLENMKKSGRLSTLTAASIANRLGKLKEEIKNDFVPIGTPARAIITFNGAPVRGNHGIVAGFAATVTGAFVGAVSAITASLNGELKDSGPIPNKGNHQLLITGTAIGSFGFEMEEVQDEQQLTIEDTDLSGLSESLEVMLKILAASDVDDEELSDSLFGLANRAIVSVNDFLYKMASHDAYCTIKTPINTFRFRNVDQVKETIKKLDINNIHEEDVSFTGHFSGVLPHKRDFEFIDENGIEIYGKISTDIPHPAQINRELGHLVSIKASKRTVGSSKPRYTLLSFKKIEK